MSSVAVREQTRITTGTVEESLVARAYVDPTSIAPKDARGVVRHFFNRLAELEEGTAEYSYVRNVLIEVNLSLVRYAASRFKHRGPQEMEDITQVGTIGLIKAIDRFELSREVEFASFAVPYITGEIKRFFRDTSWAVHVPRHLKEARLELARATEELRTRLGRLPTTAELAELMQLEPLEVAEAQRASNAYNASSLDAAVNGPDDETDSRLGDFLGIDDDRFERVDDVHSLAPLVAGLDERERRLIRLRFVEEKTQQQIAQEIGCSQMHVSRLITRVMATLRAGLTAIE